MSIGRIAASSAIMIVPALIVAALLPGVVAAAIVMVVGLVIRFAVLTITAAATTG